MPTFRYTVRSESPLSFTAEIAGFVRYGDACIFAEQRVEAAARNNCSSYDFHVLDGDRVVKTFYAAESACC